MSTQMTPPTSAEEIRRRIKDHALDGVELYNASDERHRQQVFGHFYVFEPNASLQIKPIMDYPRTPRGAPLLDQAPQIVVGADGTGALTAENVALELLKDMRCGQRGITMLQGDAFDPERKRVARQSYIKWRVGTAKKVRMEWLSKVDKVTREPGAIPPPQPDNVRAQLQFLARFEAGLIDRERYVSRIDGFESGDRAAVLASIRKYPDRLRTEPPEAFLIDTHAEFNRQESGEEIEKALAPEPEPKPGAALPADDFSSLVLVASELGVRLEKAELLGLLHGDNEITQSVVTRLATAKAKQEVDKSDKPAPKARPARNRKPKRKAGRRSR